MTWVSLSLSLWNSSVCRYITSQSVCEHEQEWYVSILPLMQHLYLSIKDAK